MSNDIPDWLGIRACEELSKDAHATWRWPRDKRRTTVKTVARVIAQHESEQVDPLLAEARELVANLAQQWDVDGESIGSPDEYRSGIYDGDADVQCALAALRRGMELAKPSEPDRFKCHEGDPVLDAAREAAARASEEVGLEEDAKRIRAVSGDNYFSLRATLKMAEVMKERGL